MKKSIIIIAILSIYVTKVIGAQLNTEELKKGAENILKIVEKTSLFSDIPEYKNPSEYCQEGGIFTTTLRSNSGEYCKNEFFAQFAYIMCYRDSGTNSREWGFSPVDADLGSKCWQILNGTGIAAGQAGIIDHNTSVNLFINNLNRLDQNKKDRLCQALTKLTDTNYLRPTILRDEVCKTGGVFNIQTLSF